MKRILQILFPLTLLGLIATILLPVFSRARESEHYVLCPSNLKQIGLGLLQYTQDYDEKLPGSSSGGGWANAVQPYLKSTQIFQCPIEPSVPAISPNPALTGFTDYFYNSQLQKRKTETLGEVARLILVADGNDGQEKTDASYSKSAIPLAWRTDSNSPAFRHAGKGNSLFADGHVKALDVEDVATNWDARKFFFQPAKQIEK